MWTFNGWSDSFSFYFASVCRLFMLWKMLYIFIYIVINLHNMLFYPFTIYFLSFRAKHINSTGKLCLKMRKINHQKHQRRGIDWTDPKLLQNVIRVENLKIKIKNEKNKAAAKLLWLPSGWNLFLLKNPNQRQIMHKPFHCFTSETKYELGLRSFLSLPMFVMVQPSQL